MQRLNLLVAIVLVGWVPIESPGPVSKSAAVQGSGSMSERARSMATRFAIQACSQAVEIEARLGLPDGQPDGSPFENNFGVDSEADAAIGADVNAKPPTRPGRSASRRAALARKFHQAACGLNLSVTPTFRADNYSVPQISGVPDGVLVLRQRIAEDATVAMDLVAYTSSDLLVGGLLCYPNDGQPHSAVIHVHGGFGGLFDDPLSNNAATCIDWAGLHGRTAFMPTFRGQDGSEGDPELCLGEADDVANGAIMLRSLEVTDPGRLAMVGGSVGGCVALKATSSIPDLSAVVAFVPPTDWRSIVEYHRTSFAPAIETQCDGSPLTWDIGGPELAYSIDTLICGHPFCDDADYDVRSPLPALVQQTAPTLIVSAESDNLVPFEQQILWSVLRQDMGNPVTMYFVDRCDPSGSPALDFDVHILGLSAYHLLSPALIGSALTFLIGQLGPS